MGLNKSTIRDKVRILLNELVEGFWQNSEIEGFIDDAAIDISTKTLCYEKSTNITLVTDTQQYSVASDCQKILGVVYDHRGLTMITPWMEGRQTAVSAGPPEYFYGITDLLGIVPVPTSSENGETVTVYYAAITDNITNIPQKFQIQAVLYTAFMCLLKAQQYAKAGQLFSLYTDTLRYYVSIDTMERVVEPPAQNQYVLKLVGPNNG